MVSTTLMEREILRRKGSRVAKYLQLRDLPDWFRGTSEYQFKAADRILESIRDDCEQGSSHRVRQCLSDIGLQPMIGDTDAKSLMALSRGNDLAFLWFILEKFYTTPGRTYSFNEQLIMSLITHLDMITTLRELDRILPIGQPSKDERRKIERLEKLNKERDRNVEITRMSKIRFMESQLESIELESELNSTKLNLPYFQILRKPIRYGAPLNWKPKDIPLHFGIYEKYSDPSYVVHNETNRWYAQHEFQPSRRVAEGVLKNEVARILKRGITAEIKKYIISNTVQMEDEMPGTKAPLCEHHKVIHGLEKSLEHQLKVIARDKCLDYFDLNTRNKESCRNRITNQLEKDVNMYLSKFRKITEPMLKQQCSVGREDTMHVIDTCNTCCAYNLNDIDQKADDEDQESPKCKHTFSAIQIIDSSDEYYTHQVNDIIQKDKECRTKLPNARGKKQQCIGDVLKRCDSELAKSKQGKKKAAYVRGASVGMGDFDSRSEIDPKRHSHQLKQKEADHNRPTVKSKDDGDCDCASFKCKTKLMSKKSENYSCDNEYLEKYNYGHCDAKSVTSTEHFFESPHDHKPFRFDFVKIFRFKTEQENVGESECNADKLYDKIKELAAKAVDSSIDFHNRDPNEPIDMDAIVSNFAKKTFKEQVELKQRDVQIVEETGRLDYSRDYYDPDDTELMHTMLKDALKLMRSNPKFVLASMPDSDKLPFLRLWICRRYGKRYSREELTKMYRQSSRIFHALGSMLNVNIPGPNKLGKRLHVSYSCRDYIARKTKHLRRSYYDLLDNSIMKQSRCLWFSMRPYHCYKTPRNTFFAYMPASLKNIYHFRTWNPNEFMDAKTAWDARESNRLCSLMLQ